MKILFLTISDLGSLDGRGIYTDLANELIARGHKMYIASACERRKGEKTHVVKGKGWEILKIKTLNIQKTNIVEKGIGTILLEPQFNRAIRRQWPDVVFDLILYSTPPITFNRVIETQKKRTGAKSFLMLKDVFPQNAVDLEMFSGRSFFYRFFRKKEKRLYAISDRIGCMSPANEKYLIDHNPGVDPSKVESCPNAMKYKEYPALSESQRCSIMEKYGLPTDKTIFVYGGNLGRPQAIGYLLKVLEANESRRDSFIVIVGSGTEYGRIERWIAERRPVNCKLMARMSNDEYCGFVNACHVALIFLDHRFTIPNFPSRLLNYLEASKPVLLATDPCTDIGRIAQDNGFGFWTESNDVDSFMKMMDRMTPGIIREMGDKGRDFLLENYRIEKVASTVLASN